eukprot:6087674-Amphidinium_carterae.1
MVWKCLLAMLEAIKVLEPPWDEIKRVVPKSQFKAAWDTVLVACMLPSRQELAEEPRAMAPDPAR